MKEMSELFGWFHVIDAYNNKKLFFWLQDSLTLLTSMASCKTTEIGSNLLRSNVCRRSIQRLCGESRLFCFGFERFCHKLFLLGRCSTDVCCRTSIACTVLVGITDQAVTTTLEYKL